MVDISTELQVIDNAVYGKDMRRAIRDALQKLANAINQGGGGSAGNKVMHVANHDVHKVLILNEELDYDDVVLVDSDKTIVSHVTENPDGTLVHHTYVNTETGEEVQYIGELYGMMEVSNGDEPELNEGE